MKRNLFQERRLLLHEIPCQQEYPRCLYDPGWFESVDMNYCQNIIKCLDRRCRYCPHHLLFGYDLCICTCPIAKLIVNSVQNGMNNFKKTEIFMEQVKTALILSSDQAIRDHFASLIQKTGNAYILETKKTSALIRVLEYPFRFIIIDAVESVPELIDFMRVLKRLRPRLPILILLDENFQDFEDQLVEEGAAYCFFKKQEEPEFSQKFIELFEYV